MGKFMQVAAGIVLMCLGVGAMVHVMKSGDWWILFPLLFLVVMLFRKCGDDGADERPELDGSVSQDLERRMNDLQDIVLGLDDKLTRLSKKLESAPAPSTEDERSG